jgi:hypothetical protein
MLRLQADASSDRWVPVTESWGFRGRRHRKTAIRMLLTQASGAVGGQPGAAQGRGGGGVAAWLMSQATPFLMRRAAGRVLAWTWKADPELVVVLAQVVHDRLQRLAAEQVDGGVGLGVAADLDDALPLHGKRRREVAGDSGLADAALTIDGDLEHCALPGTYSSQADARI